MVGFGEEEEAEEGRGGSIVHWIEDEPDTVKRTRES